MSSKRSAHGRAWGVLAAVTVAGVLASLLPLQQGQAQGCPCDGITSEANCTSTVWISRLPECGGNIYCPWISGTCFCPRIRPELSCCQLNSTTCEDNHTCDECVTLGGQFALGASCAGGCVTPTPTATATTTSTASSTATSTATETPTGTPTDTPTATPTGTATGTPADTPTVTPTNTRVPDGGSCDDPADCISGNCVDDTCCAEASCPPGQSCDNPGNAGVCSPDPVAPAPAITPTGVLLALALLLGIGGVALVRRRRGA